MSHAATNWAIQQRGLRPGVKLVLWHLADRHHPDNGCFPSQDTLAHDAEVPKSTLNVYLDELEKRGLIARERRRSRGSQRQERTRYYFPFEPDFARFSAGSPSPETGDGNEAGAESRNQPEPSPENARSRVQNLDSNPVIEPVKEPLREGACEREQGGPVSGSVPRGEAGQGDEAGDADASSHGHQPDSAATIERLYWRLIKGWPGFEGMPKTAGWKAFCDLSEDDRALALARRDAWIDGLKRNGRKHVPAPQTYCRERLFADVVAAPAKAAPVEAAPFGRAWFAARMARLLEPSLPVNTRLTAVQQQQVAAGIESVDRIMAERRRREGWPIVTRMDEAARRRRPVAVLPAFEELGACCARVRVGSALWQAWAEHAQRVGWPWFEGCGMPEWVWLPGSGVDGLEAEAEVVAALERFAGLVQAAGLIRERGEHHG